MSRRRRDDRTPAQVAQDAEWRTLRVLCSGRDTHGREVMARLVVHEDDLRGMSPAEVLRWSAGEVDALVTVDSRETAAPVVHREADQAAAAAEVAELMRSWGAPESDLAAEARAVREVLSRRRGADGPLHQTYTFRCTRCGRNVAMREEKFKRGALALILSGASSVDVSRLDRVSLT